MKKKNQSSLARSPARCSLILASASPRRRQLLKKLKIPFRVIPSDASENSKQKNPVHLVQELALRKAKQIAARIAPHPAPSPSRGEGREGVRWVPFDEQEIPRLVASGKPVFVDVTADWCVTCKYNERFVLSDPDVVAEFKKRNVVMMRADWTNQDPAIGRYLMSSGRAGIPFYALYYPYRDPVLLSEFLTKKQVLRELRVWDALQ